MVLIGVFILTHTCTFCKPAATAGEYLPLLLYKIITKIACAAPNRHTVLSDFINLTQVHNFTVSAQDILPSVDFRYLP